MFLTGRAVVLTALGALAILLAPSTTTALLWLALVAGACAVDVALAASPRAAEVSRDVTASVRLGETARSTLTVRNPGRRPLHALVLDPISESYIVGFLCLALPHVRDTFAVAVVSLEWVVRTHDLPGGHEELALAAGSAELARAEVGPGTHCTTATPDGCTGVPIPGPPVLQRGARVLRAERSTCEWLAWWAGSTGR